MKSGRQLCDKLVKVSNQGVVVAAAEYTRLEYKMIRLFSLRVLPGVNGPRSKSC